MGLRVRWGLRGVIVSVSVGESVFVSMSGSDFMISSSMKRCVLIRD